MEFSLDSCHSPGESETDGATAGELEQRAQLEQMEQRLRVYQQQGRRRGRKQQLGEGRRWTHRRQVINNNTPPEIVYKVIGY